MYDQATYDDVAEVLNMADAGLMGMYIGDCRAGENGRRAGQARLRP
jgi:hypothetical protein